MLNEHKIHYGNSNVFKKEFEFYSLVHAVILTVKKQILVFGETPYRTHDKKRIKKEHSRK